MDYMHNVDLCRFTQNCQRHNTPTVVKSTLPTTVMLTCVQHTPGLSVHCDTDSQGVKTQVLEHCDYSANCFTNRRETNYCGRE